MTTRSPEEIAADVLKQLHDDAQYMPCPYNDPHDGTRQAKAKAIIAAAIRAERVLYDAAWEECQRGRSKYGTTTPDKGYCVLIQAHDQARHAAGRE